MALHHMLRAAVQQQAAGPSDPYFEYNTLLLTGDGTNGAQNNTFLDSSTNNFTITRNGNTTQGTFSPYGNLWSNYFDGSSAYLSAPTNTAFAFGTGDFTIEAWIYDSGTTAAYGQIVGASTYGVSNEFLLSLNGTTRTLYAQLGSTGGTSSTGTVSANTWNHVAVVRSGTTVTFYINGTSGGSYTDSDNVTSTIVTTIGASNNNNADSKFKGYISNLRVVKGTALYTSNFTPSTTPLTAVTGTSLLTCQSNRFIDNSSNNFTLTVNGTPSVQRFSPFNPTAPYSAATIGGSGYFDGTGDYLQLAGSSNLVLGTNSFTLEAWLYPIGNGSIYSNTDSWQAGRYNWVLGQGGSGVLSFIVNSIGDTVTVTGVKYNAWNHIAVTRSGSNWYGFLNGVLSATFTSATSIGDPSNIPIRMGITDGGSAMPLNGIVSNLRLVIGTAVYTSSFTPPTAPLTAISNTQLLMSYTNAGIPDAAMMNDLETVGNAQVSTSVKKYGTGSLYFDGSGDYLTSAVSPVNAIGGGNFTVEAWVYPTGYNGGWAVYSQINTYPSSTGILLYINGGGTAIFNVNGDVFSGSTVALNQWTHLALVRNGSTITLYQNGTSTGSTSLSTNFTDQYCTIGRTGYGTASNYALGYIDDLRITKGYARYTANFTPPTAALPVY